MSLGGGWPVDVVVIRHWIGATNASTTIGPFFFVSRMPTFSSVVAIAALSDVSNEHEANDARWAVWPTNVTKVGANTVSYQISYTVDDSDGHLDAVSLMFVMVP
jgi:hypothetical protein